jgi:hypothetical protein
LHAAQGRGPDLGRHAPRQSVGDRRPRRADAGLYQAGELVDAVGALYPANDANISDARCFHRIAAEHALLPRRAGELMNPEHDQEETRR